MNFHIRKIKNISICFILSILFISCRTIKHDDYIVQDNTPILLPSLEPVVYIDNIKEKISRGRVNISENIEVEKLTTHMYGVNSDISIKYIPDKRIIDIIKAFSNDIKRNIIDTNLKTIGSIHLNIMSFKEAKSNGLMFLSAWLFFTPNLLGFPLSEIKTDMIIQIQIKDSNDKTIKTYESKGAGKSYIAMYWGYGEDAQRKSTILAFQDAMSNIKLQILNDKNELKEMLEKK